MTIDLSSAGELSNHLGSLVKHCVEIQNVIVSIRILVSCVASSIFNLKGSDWLGMGVELRVQFHEIKY